MKPVTPLPWEWHQPYGGNNDEADEGLYVAGGTRTTAGDWGASEVVRVCWAPGEAWLEIAPEDKAYIVHACNLYPELVEVLRSIDEYWELGDTPLSPDAWITDKDAAIAEVVHDLLAQVGEQG